MTNRHHHEQELEYVPVRDEMDVLEKVVRFVAQQNPEHHIGLPWVEFLLQIVPSETAELVETQKKIPFADFQ